MTDLYPAIDLRGGRCVRLLKGDYDAETRYDTDPVEVARSFAAAGAPWIHIVDLDAARSGRSTNLEVIAAVCAAVDVPVQSGGGVRTPEAAAALAAAGVSRVVVGTAAVENPALVEALASRQRVAVGLDVRGAEVAIHGWEQGSGLALDDMLARFEGCGAEAVVITQIERDGTLEGPDVDLYRRTLSRTGMDVIASGGVGDLGDLSALEAVEAAGRRISGVIVGKAIHDGVFTVAGAVEVLARPDQPIDREDGT
ncbi:MAG TPA: 1-(5-phosphoribosyl)-5-[(5-phosphoribosylamino)methylideneamino]imidazole-4-carboxamide isomerase [Acidimicrobiales bacterium]|nr:1-(5-phosphoribosyl)-5-[(5-phosphoribosylamino)methylideneamino]imidazole-4-carboxamide isomerase [Acidimicrobiales bacterium]